MITLDHVNEEMNLRSLSVFTTTNQKCLISQQLWKPFGYSVYYIKFYVMLMFIA